MMQAALWSVAMLLALAPAGIALSMRKPGSAILYGACLLVSSALAAIALLNLLDPSHPVLVATLPIGLPWLGAHFRIDPLAAFFLAVVNLGGAAASLFALGYGRHEEAPGRVLPFYPAYLAAMNIVVLSDDAFSFLVAWEFMSLTSWALVVSHHREAENVRAGYIYLLMAGFGTLALLLAFGVLAVRRPVRFCRDPRHPSIGRRRQCRIVADADRRRLEGRPGAAACLVAARASRGAQPCLRLDERRDDEGRGLRLRAHRLRSARAAGMVVEHGRARRRRSLGDAGRAVRADAARHQARAGIFDNREYRHHLCRARACARLQGGEP